jgi:hypothetical protein
MTISLLTTVSLILCAYSGLRLSREFRRMRLESRMCRAVRLAFLD